MKYFNRTVKIIVILKLTVLLILASGCAAQTSKTAVKKEQAKAADTPRAAVNMTVYAIQQTVWSYNLGLVEALKTLDNVKLKPYTTDKQSREDELYLSYLREKRRVTELDQLLQLKVTKVDSGDGTALVKTLEVWRVKQKSMETKKVTDFGEIYYRNAYNLIKKKEKWYIDSIESTELNSAGRKK